MAEQITSSGYYQNHYKFNGKELDNETGMYYYGARYYEPRLSVWMSVDPIAEKYPNMSPFVYCANNPMMFVDPDGNTFRIWYVDVNNKNQSFVFNGTNASSAPQNTYVQNFIKAYNYDVGNGGGTSLKTIATSTKNEVSIAEAHGTSASNGGSAIFWNPNDAELTTDNKVLSPSTVLEEEATHYLHWIRNAKELYELRKKPVPKFDNAEEERTKLNEVAKTARANKEVPSKWVPKDHHSSAIGVDDPTSNKPTKESNTKFFNKLEKNTPYDWTEEKKKADTYLKNQ